MISYAAFSDEMVKIAEEERKKPIDRKRLGRALLVAGAAGLGAGAGIGADRLYEMAARKYGLPGAVAKGVPRSILRKWGLPVIGTIGGAGAALLAMMRKKADEYIDEGQRPKQHSSFGRVS